MDTKRRRRHAGTFGVGTGPFVTSISPGSDRPVGGAVVVIVGGNFTGATTVTFDGVPSPLVTIITPRTLTAVAPAHAAGLVDVVVTNDGQSGTLFNAFSYYATVILSVTPNHGPIAGGTPVVLLGYNFQVGSLVYFDGILATDIAVIDAQHISCVTPSHSLGFIDVTVVEPG